MASTQLGFEQGVQISMFQMVLSYDLVSGFISFFLIDSIDQIDGVLSEGYSSWSETAETSENKTSVPPTENRLKSFGCAENI